MRHLVCHWLLGYALVNPLRRLWQDPRAILAPHVREGMCVLEPGPGMGFFTLDLAQLVGPGGRVVAVDVQRRMLSNLRKRARRAGLADRIEAREVGKSSLAIDDLAGRVDFVLAFAVVHEMPDAGTFFVEAARALKPGGRLLLAEPRGHVSREDMERTISQAASAGFRVADRPPIRGSRTALLVRA